MRRRALLVLVAALAAAASLSAATPRDHALLALDILPPGEGANLPDLTTQLAMYDDLTPLRGNVTAADLGTFYKQETLGLGRERAVRVERPKDGVTIGRDRFEVPHIVGTTRANTEFGAGWATAEDRGLYLQLLRGPARISALDIPGYDAFSLALSASTFVPGAQTEAFLALQVKLARRTAPGRQLIRDVDAYIAGINADDANPGGSSYGAGWYEYVDKDLRTLTGQRLHGVYSTRYCGGADLKARAASLWTALDAAVSAAPPTADATADRIRFGAAPRRVDALDEPADVRAGRRVPEPSLAWAM